MFKKLKEIKKYAWTIFFTLFVTVNIAQAGIVEIPFNGESVGLKDFSESTGDTVKDGREDGAKQINNAVMALVNWLQTILGTIATVWVVWQGYLMLTSRGNQDQFEKAQTSIGWAVTALVLSFLVEPFIRNVIYGGGEILAPGQAILNPEVSTRLGILEIEGLMEWIRTIIGVIAVAMIIFTGIRAMLAMSSEDEINNQKNNIQAIAMGIIIIIINEVIIKSGLYQDPHINPATGKFEVTTSTTSIISELGGFAGYILSFFAVIAVSGIVYGGFLILTASFDEDQASKGKSIIINTILGVLIAVVSYTLVRTLIFL